MTSVPLGIGEKFVLCLLGSYLAIRFFGGVAAFGFLLLGLCWQFFNWYRASTFWKRLGVPCDFAWPLLGHTQLMTKGFHNCDMQWMKKYGKLYGSYLLTQAEIVVSDEEILKRVLVKDFNNFTNRRTFFNGNKSLFTRMVSAMRDEEWKNTRNAVTPAFTSGKLKNTLELMEHCVDIMCTIVGKQTDFENGLEVKRIMGNMTMDVIAAAAFALNVDAQHDPDNAFTSHARKLGSITFKDWRILVTILFPWTLGHLDNLFNIRVFFAGIEEYYVENLSKVIKQRRQNPNVEKLDFLQLLINAADNNNEKSVESELDTSVEPANKNWRMPDRDIIAQSFLFLVAGHETTATTLAFACYCLAWNQEAQEKAYEEIKGLVEKDGAISYDHIQKSMPYLDAVLSETLRLYPPATRFDRVCMNDYQLIDQLTIPKGTILVVPVFAIQHNPDNYEDPEKFIPERFLDKDKKQSNPFIHLPFGYGPRHCIGMRFAQLEAKLALSNLLRKFRIETCPETEPMPPVLDITNMLRTKKPIRLNFRRREE